MSDNVIPFRPRASSNGHGFEVVEIFPMSGMGIPEIYIALAGPRSSGSFVLGEGRDPWLKVATFREDDVAAVIACAQELSRDYGIRIVDLAHVMPKDEPPVGDEPDTAA